MKVQRYAKLAVPFLTIAALHLVIVLGYFQFAALALAIGPALNLVLSVLNRDGKTAIMLFGLILLLLLAIEVVILLGDGAFERVVVLPPILIHGWLAYLFGSTLLPGSEPLIHRFSRLSRGEVPVEMERYTYWMTVVWTCLFIVMLVASLVIGLTARLEVWSWIVNVGFPLVSLFLFLSEHAYRAVVFRRFGHNSPVESVRLLLRPDVWLRP